jgi:polysaccharide biosynthesis protein PslG
MTFVRRMPDFRILFQCLSALLMLSGIASRPLFGAPLPEWVVPDGFGVNIHFTGEPKDLDLIRDAGFRFIRMDLSWSSVERQKGIYDFEKAGYDALTAGCTKRGIRIIYILDYSNKLYEPERSIRSETGRKAFATFARAAAERYSGKGVLWEIWNEPNIKQFWVPQPDVENYCKLVEEVAPLVRQADPSGAVLAPATSGIPFDWLESCFKKGLLGWIDVLSVHPYRSQSPETVVQDYARLRNLVGQYAAEGKQVPILSGEWGYSNVNWDSTRLSDEQQGRYLVRMFLTNLHERVPLSIWYDWKNDGADPNEREHNFGTVGRDLRPKPAYVAAKTLASTLAGFAIEKRLDRGSQKDFIFLLTKGNRRAAALWTTDSDHEVILPLEASGGTLVNLLGQSRRVSWQAGQLKLTVSADPQYLLIGD